MSMARVGRDHFHVTLPSNSSHHVYGRQSPSHYKTLLQRELNVDPADWEFGLSELSYSRTWPNVRGAWLHVYLPKMPQRERMQHVVVPLTLPDGRYESASHLVDSLEDLLKHTLEVSQNVGAVRLIYNQDTKKTDVYCEYSYGICLGAVLSIALGFGEFKQTFIKHGNVAPPPLEPDSDGEINVVEAWDASTSSPLRTDPHRTLTTLYVYADIVPPQLVGHSHVPLVRAVVDRGQSKDETVSIPFSNVHYLPLSRGTIREIEIHITDDTGRDIAFVDGRSVVKLHFRKRK